jgi:hypothetical protein
MNTRSRGQHPPNDDNTTIVCQEIWYLLAAIFLHLDGLGLRMSSFESDIGAFQDHLTSLTTPLDNGVIHLEDTQRRLSSLEQNPLSSLNLTPDAL